MISRRRFLQSSLSLALVPLLPRVAVSATLSVRPSWQAFITGPKFPVLCNTIGIMKANKNSADPNAWTFWSEVHRLNCPHGQPYFLAWHRGFLYRFENKLREISGDPTLTLPYWNYYLAPAVPAEFLDPSSPLYRGDRTGFDVTGALSYDAFAPTIIYFQRGKTDAFEPIVEARPHNRVHNLIGGAMSSILISPKDPLFWVHHANIDRLWVAWLKAGGGRRQPAPTNTYWSGTFTYGTGIDDMPRVWTNNTTTYLGYRYDDETLPTQTTTKLTSVASALTAGAPPLRPSLHLTVPLGSSRPLALDERSLSIDVPLGATDAARVRSLMLRPTVGQTAETGPVRVVLDGVRLTALGERGGYFYNVYLNLPEQPGTSRPESTFLLGSLGPFEIGVARMQAAMQGMHGMQEMHASHDTRVKLVFPAIEALRRVWPADLDKLTVSFVRVDGRRQPVKGEVIRVESFRVEADPAF
ncbi:tyrosinase family protein [Fulvimonas yonginensis]|uniref:Tyrosinase family protein n=1 Tax=Fulvimonas yonginensis TaxID=1495200 RepID=A0ABU8JDG9_9GAMM